MRSVERFFVRKRNSLWYWTKVQNPLRIVLNFVIIYLARILPSLTLKNTLYKLLGIKIGKDVSVGLGVTLDIFLPNLIEIGENSIIGFNTVILTHEFLVDEFRKGGVRIGKNVLIGANCMILPGVEVGDGAVVSACSLINRNVASGEFVGGIPIKRIQRRRTKHSRKL